MEADSELGEEELAEVGDAIVNGNSLTLNSLTLNALSPGALASIQDPGSNGNLARQALNYIVSCALGPSGSFSFSWTDSSGITHDETYHGLMGLTPQWANGPLVSSESQWISACLIARVNWYEVPVQISARGSNAALNHPGSAELAGFPAREGAFWGDLFSTPPQAYSCYEPSQISHARQLSRDCAAGHLKNQNTVQECGIIQIVGSCTAACANPNPAYGYHSVCAGSMRPITVFLP